MGDVDAKAGQVNFKANAAIKDIVGRGLIYDDNIAIIELVKNSKDANSPNVVIRFDKESKISESSSLVISDKGAGMTFHDVVNKWLNIAYSEKKSAAFKDRSPYAGNKGVGRFSCDRLGSRLTLYTKSENGDFLKLPINWELFEDREQDDEISSIILKCDTLSRGEFLKEIDDQEFEHGTVLKISSLRSEWGSKKLRKLIAELEKFSPDLDSAFEVFIHSSTEHNDAILNQKINQKINNNILQKLSFKTTFIKSQIDAAGKEILTSLYYQGDEVYKYVAENPYPQLRNISVEVHYLDALSKSYFTRNAGVSPNEYGSIFLFYNGFRISPYGNSKNDWLSLDQRKSQGTARYLGTREVFGRIDIMDEARAFSVITSREGLAHNKAFSELVAFDTEEKVMLSSGKESYGYATTIIRQLENFVVSGLDWNRLFDRLAPPDSKRIVNVSDVQNNPGRYQLKSISPDKVKEACDRILKSDLNVLSIDVNNDLIIKISEKASEKYQLFLDDFVEKTKNKTIKELSSSEKGALKAIVVEERVRAHAAREDRDYAERKLRQTEHDLNVEKKKRYYAENYIKPDSVSIKEITHNIGNISDVVYGKLEIILDQIDDLNNEELNSISDGVRSVLFQVEKMKNLSKVITKANFNMMTETIRGDFFSLVEEYINLLSKAEAYRNLELRFINEASLTFILNFNPVEQVMLVDNVIDNSIKANASVLSIVTYEDELRYYIDFIDNGDGLTGKYSPEELFSPGISTTSGSGTGLSHIKNISENLGAKAEILAAQPKGCALRLWWNK